MDLDSKYSERIFKFFSGSCEGECADPTRCLVLVLDVLPLLALDGGTAEPESEREHRRWGYNVLKCV